MSDTVKLIIEIPKKEYEAYKELIAINIGRCSGKGIIQTCLKAVKNGTPLDSNSERAEVQAYFAGESYGWEQGRKALIEDAKAEMEKLPTDYCGGYIGLSKKEVLGILDSIGEGDKE